MVARGLNRSTAVPFTSKVTQAFARVAAAQKELAAAERAAARALAESLFRSYSLRKYDRVAILYRGKERTGTLIGMDVSRPLCLRSRPIAVIRLDGAKRRHHSIRCGNMQAIRKLC